MHNNPICIEIHESIYNLICMHKMLIVRAYTVNRTDCHVDDKKQLYYISFVFFFLSLEYINMHDVFGDRWIPNLKKKICYYNHQSGLLVFVVIRLVSKARDVYGNANLKATKVTAVLPRSDSWSERMRVLSAADP